MFPFNIFAQLGAIGEFIGIEEGEEENLGAVRTMSGSVIEKGRTGFGFVYQYIRFVAYHGDNDLATAFIDEGKYNFREYEVGKYYFLSHGVTDKFTFTLFINEFLVQSKYMEWNDTNKNGTIDYNNDDIEYKTETHQDLGKIWLQGTYQLSKKLGDSKIAVNGALRLPTAYEKEISNDSVGLFLGIGFTKKLWDVFLLGDIGFNYYTLSTTLSRDGQDMLSYYPGSSVAAHMAIIHSYTNRFTIGAELAASSESKPKYSNGQSFGNSQSSLDIAPMMKFKVTPKTVFYSSVSYKLLDKTNYGYDYGYIFGLNYLFD